MFSLLRMSDPGECLCSERNSISTVRTGTRDPPQDCCEGLDLGPGAEEPDTPLQSLAPSPGLRWAPLRLHPRPPTWPSKQRGMYTSQLTDPCEQLSVWTEGVPAAGCSGQPSSAMPSVGREKPTTNWGGRAIGTHRSGGTRMDGFSRVCILPKDFMPLTPTRCQPLMAKKWRDLHSSPVSCGDRQPGQTARIFRWEIEAQRAETELRGPLGALTGAQSHDITVEPLGLY